MMRHSKTSIKFIQRYSNRFFSNSLPEYRCSKLITALSSNNIVSDINARTPSDLFNVKRSRFSSQAVSKLSATATIEMNMIQTKNSEFNDVNDIQERITVVQDKKTAKAVLKILKSHPSAIWACDTEVADIDVANQSPVGNGQVICFSIYGGPTIDFGKGPGGILWVENIDESNSIALEFKEWFENENYKKIWHNYGFDRHVLYNIAIDCKGFHADTMHMARLWDSSLDKSEGGAGYSLEGLTSLLQNPMFEKKSMKELFGQSKLRKDGTMSKIKELPEIRELQRNEMFREKWIEYSSRDALATWHVYRYLEERLSKMSWVIDGKQLGNMMGYYHSYLSEFGELLTDMERNGIMVDTKDHLRQAEIRAREERSKMEKLFLDWAVKICPDAKYMNPSSSAQIQQLFFGKYDEYGQRTLVERERKFVMEKNEAEYAEEHASALQSNPYLNHTINDLKALLKERKLKLSGKKSELVQRLMAYDKKPPNPYESLDMKELKNVCLQLGIDEVGTREVLIERLADDAAFKEEYNQVKDSANKEVNMTKIKKYREFTITTLAMEPLAFTPKGQPQVSAAILKKMAGQNLFNDDAKPVWGTAYKFFRKPQEGEEACRAIGALATMGQIDATITNFLVPLQALVDKNSRIHCSLNLNTETGRLSSRRPNLQNQPALEKDQYKIRDAFIAAPGNTLIVADYGQLELRILAHITNCKSMIDAFAKGGCFHSRTAVGMYDYIRDAVENGQVMLEWDYSKGQPNVPLVKDKYGSERRKAKTLNFSIAYGKTVHGLAQDWGISKEEAQKTLDAWYNDRPEVKQWQDKTKAFAIKNGYVRTIMGRYRQLEEAQSNGHGQGHALRAAINTPIQGSAADIVIMAMIKLWKSEVLKSLGWKLLLQIHDEVILEGPKETMNEAMKEVRQCMENPFDGYGLNPLLVHLDVDAKSADSWYKAK